MKCPCKNCITYAICINKERIKCSSVNKYISEYKMKNHYKPLKYWATFKVTALFKAFILVRYSNSYGGGFRFVKNKDRAYEIMRNSYRYLPKDVRCWRMFRFRYYQWLKVVYRGYLAVEMWLNRSWNYIVIRIKRC